MDLFYFVKDRTVLAVSTQRHGGVSLGNYASLNLCDYTGDELPFVLQNRKLFCQRYWIDPVSLYFPRQIHGTEVQVIDSNFISSVDEVCQSALNGVDALITNLEEVYLGINTADCVPIFLYDPIKRVIGVAHAGWRGTCYRIVENTIQKMKNYYDCRPADLKAAIGVSISKTYYEVGEELKTEFEIEHFSTDILFTKSDTSGKYYLDLWEANRQVLMESGVSSEQIEISGVCTYANSNDYFSARRLGIHSGRIASVIGMRNSGSLNKI